jgi:hypothetical protein
MLGWSSYRDFTFAADSDDILRADDNKAQEIADYLALNPSFRIGIDGASESRVANVRDALMDAGVPSRTARS